MAEMQGRGERVKGERVACFTLSQDAKQRVSMREAAIRRGGSSGRSIMPSRK